MHSAKSAAIQYETAVRRTTSYYIACIQIFCILLFMFWAMNE